MPCQGGIQLQKKNVVQNKMQDMEYTAIMSGLWNQDLPVSFSPTRAASVSSLTSAMLGSPGANSAQQEVELHQQDLSVLVPTSSSSSTATSHSPVQGMTIHKVVRICPVCAKRITADNLTRHEKSHGSLRPLHCDLCGLNTLNIARIANAVQVTICLLVSTSVY